MPTSQRPSFVPPSRLTFSLHHEGDLAHRLHPRGPVCGLDRPRPPSEDGVLSVLWRRLTSLTTGSTSSAKESSYEPKATSHHALRSLTGSTSCPDTCDPSGKNPPLGYTVPTISHPEGKCEKVKIDFSAAANGKRLKRGDYVDNEWAEFGLKLSSSGGFGKKPRIFDSSNPGNEKYGDLDLGSPNERCDVRGRKPGVGEGGEPDAEGANCEPLGNLLIIQEKNNKMNIPDDNVDGGEIYFEFTKEVNVFEMGFLDIDYAASIKVEHSSGVSDINLPLLGDNAAYTAHIDLSNVKKMTLKLTRSGAVSFITFCSPTDDHSGNKAPTDDVVDVTVDFSETDEGTPLVGGEYVDSEWAKFGLKLSSSGGYGRKPRIFDSSNPGNKEDGDLDLGSPNAWCPGSGRKPGEGVGGEPGQKGENCEPLGNLLIIQEKNNKMNIPDDNVDGGEVVFDFTTTAEYVFKMGFLDLDYEASLTIVQEIGTGRTESIILLPLLGDNSAYTADIDLPNVKQIRLKLARSGAVSFISFRTKSHYPPKPHPPTYTTPTVDGNPDTPPTPEWPVTPTGPLFPDGDPTQTKLGLFWFLYDCSSKTMYVRTETVNGKPLEEDPYKNWVKSGQTKLLDGKSNSFAYVRSSSGKVIGWEGSFQLEESDCSLEVQISVNTCGSKRCNPKVASSGSDPRACFSIDCGGDECNPKCSECRKCHYGKCIDVPEGTACNDGDACTAGETCSKGICTGGSVVVCSECKSCDTVTGCVIDDTLPCDDGNACTTGEGCAGGICTGGIPNCGECQVCKEPDGSCDSVNDGTPCDDGDSCTSEDVCYKGQCVGTPCGECFECKKGNCEWKPANAPCDDADPCTINDSCWDGQCVGGSPKCGECQECNPVDGTCSPKSNGESCSDSNACTEGDKCQNGACVPGAPKCGECQECNPVDGKCSRKSDGSSCSDGNACTVGDECQKRSMRSRRSEVWRVPGM